MKRELRVGIALIVFCASLGRAQEDPSSSDPASEDPSSGEGQASVKEASVKEGSVKKAGKKGRFGGLTLDELKKDLESDFEARLIIDPESGDLQVLVHGNVEWRVLLRGEPVFLRCDRLVVFAPGALGRLDGSKTEEANEDSGEADSPSGSEESSRTEAAPDETVFWFFADGNVWLRLIDQESTIEASSLYYERKESGDQVCLLRKARLLTTVSGAKQLSLAASGRDVRGVGPSPNRRTFEALPLAVSADSLRTTDFRSFSGENLRASTCDFEVPHYSVGAPAAAVAPVPGGSRDIRIDFHDPRFELDGGKVVGLPLDRWDTRWHDWLPIREVHLGSSGKYGAFAGVDWNLNFFLNWTPVERVPLLGGIIRQSRLDFETTYMTDRGFGWGPKGEYGLDPLAWEPLQKSEDWGWYGESRYFAIHDTGTDRSSSTQFMDPDRFWGNVNHRQKVPYVGLIDVEYSERSDQNFLREYFEPIAKREKQQENLFLWRRNIGDNLALSGLYKYQVNDFQAEVERLPEGRAQLFEQNLLGTGLYTDLTAQASYFHTRPSAGSPDPEREFGRMHVGSEWSYPVRLTHPWFDVRPFFSAELSSYSELADASRGSEDRLALGSGVTVSQQWSRAFDTEETALDRWFGIEQLKHVVVPRATYFNRFSNDLEPTEVIGIDGIDTIDMQETVSFSVRQAFFSRRDLAKEGQRQRPLLGRQDLWLDVRQYDTRMVVDSDVSVVFFPRRERDNNGDSTSLVFFDNTVYPGDWIWLRAWLAVDMNEGFRLDTTDISATVEFVPDVLSITVGDRYSRRPTNPRGDANYIYSLASLDLGDRWRVQGFWSQDIETGRNSELSFALARKFHRFAMVLEYSLDPGEDDNQTVSVNFAPASMLGSLRRGLTDR